MSIKQKIGPLSWIDKLFLIALSVRLAYGFIGMVTPTDPPGAALVRGLFILVALIFLVGSFPKWARKMLWRVRHRLLVTWVLVGVVPIVLICVLVTEGAFMLLGQAVSYMTSSRITQQTESVRGLAYTLGWQIAHRPAASTPQSLTETFVREISDIRKFQVGAVVRSGKETLAVPAGSVIQKIPEWSMPDFHGVVAAKEMRYLAAHVALGDSSDRTEVFLYQQAPPEFFEKLLSGIAAISLDRGTAAGGNLNVYTTDEPRSGFSVGSGGLKNDPDVKDVPP